MQPFILHTGVLAPLDRANVDTDAIIPKQFLKLIGRTGFGQYLFHDWRYLADGAPNPHFELNKPGCAGASILVARNNFGCGSSREHAVWAVAQYGFRVIIAPWRQHHKDRLPAFADIFRNNCGKNGVLTIELSETEVDHILHAAHAQPGLQATVDLPQQTVTLHTAPAQIYRFEVDPGLKEFLLRGLDEIALTLEHEADIAAFEQHHDAQCSGAR